MAVIGKKFTPDDSHAGLDFKDIVYVTSVSFCLLEA
jgi:hypothetical protein